VPRARIPVPYWYADHRGAPPARTRRFQILRRPGEYEYGRVRRRHRPVDRFRTWLALHAFLFLVARFFVFFFFFFFFFFVAARRRRLDRRVVLRRARRCRCRRRPLVFFVEARRFRFGAARRLDRRVVLRRDRRVRRRGAMRVVVRVE